MTCFVGLADRRQIFWATQPAACGEVNGCFTECGKPGLQINSVGNAKTIAKSDYVRGLALNILLTDARREDTLCGYRPGARGGYWADSFRSDRGYSGSRLRQLTSTGSIRESLALIRAFAEADLSKLIAYGVATSVSVTVEYLGRSAVSLVAVITGQSNDVTRVGVTGTRLSNSWVWTS